MQWQCYHLCLQFYQLQFPNKRTKKEREKSRPPPPPPPTHWNSLSTWILLWQHCWWQLVDLLKPGFHIVVSVVSVVRKKFIGQIQLYGNLPYKCSIQKKWQIQLVVRDEFYRSYEFFSYDKHDRYDMETRLKRASTVLRSWTLTLSQLKYTMQTGWHLPVWVLDVRLPWRDRHYSTQSHAGQSMQKYSGGLLQCDKKL